MPLSSRDLVWALVLVSIWGGSFTVIKLGLGDVPPMMLGALRYALSAFPAILFFPIPRAPLLGWVAYGMTVGVGQFALLFLAVRWGLPAGVASVALQAQAFFTLIFARCFLGENIGPPQWIGMVLASVGLGLLMAPNSTVAQPHSLAAHLLILGAAASWAASNVVLKRLKQAADPDKPFDVLGFIVWTSVVPPVPFALLSWWTGEFASAAVTLRSIAPVGWMSILYLAWGGTLLGNGIFSKLLGRYPVTRVAPVTLLVPILGLFIAWWALGEQISLPQYIGCTVIMFGLIVSTFSKTARGPSGHVLASSALNSTSVG